MNDICLNRVPISPTQTCPPEIQILLDNAYVPFVLEFSMYWVPKLKYVGSNVVVLTRITLAMELMEVLKRYVYNTTSSRCMNKSADGELVLGFLEYDNFHCTPVAGRETVYLTLARSTK
uniref:Uncharacterized protein n=1 Tax=Rhizophagus irregularis (strain DAOM 181602 / DAOM 197198 / MUCL 43194) TaxID=747089 RepID=U9T220_RHIID